MENLNDKKDLSLPQLVKNIIRLFGCNPDNFKLGDDIYPFIMREINTLLLSASAQH